ncbi:MAG: integrase arm-type DNA-binding domain-containing protein [Burkholderiaceae bacterium]
MALSDTFVRAVKASGKSSGDKHTDGFGLYLLVKPAGKYWRMDYRFAGMRKTLALGVYPAVSLAKARKARDAARELLADGKDPSAAKRAEKAARMNAAANSFELVTREFHALKSPGWSPTYASKWLGLMVGTWFPALGRRPLADITSADLLAVLRKVEAAGTIEKAHTLKQNAGQVFRFGVQTGRCSHDPAAPLTGALAPLVVKHMPALTDPQEVGALLRAIDGYTGQPATRGALQLSALLFQRPANVRQMEWAWIDLDAAMLTIPAASMKRSLSGKANGRPHYVPLAPQAVAILTDLKALTGGGRYVFPSMRTGERPMSNNTINAAMRRMGFAVGDMTAHGFRAMARTLLGEQLDTDPEVIEAQLAHGKSGALGAAYDRTSYLKQRRDMMNTWANYLDKLRRGADVIQLRGAA